jgi:hypothetical protein
MQSSPFEANPISVPSFQMCTLLEFEAGNDKNYNCLAWLGLPATFVNGVAI